MSKNGRKVTIAIGVLIVAGISISLWFFSRPILVGVVVPITMSLGNEENLFMRYYQDRHPKINLRSVRFIITNPPPIEAEVKSAYQRLDAQGVSVIVGGVLSQDGSWLVDAAATAGIPTFGITSSSALLSGKRDSFFRLVPTNASQAMAVGQYYQKKGLKRLVVVTSVDNTAYVDPYLKVTKENFSGETVQIPFISAAEVSQKINDARPDGVFTILPAKDVIQVIKVARDLRPGILIGSSSWGSVEILSLYSGPLLDGVQFFTMRMDIQGEGYRADIADFEDKYHMKATNGSHYSASILHIVYEAIRKVGASREAIKAYFQTAREYDTSYGKVAIDDFGDGMTDRITILQSVNGFMTMKETIELQQPGQAQ